MCKDKIEEYYATKFYFTRSFCFVQDLLSLFNEISIYITMNGNFIYLFQRPPVQWFHRSRISKKRKINNKAGTVPIFIVNTPL